MVILRTKDSAVTTMTDARGLFWFMFHRDDRSEYSLEVSKSGFVTSVSKSSLPETGFAVEITLR
jgi:hypothetical protein